MPPWWSTTTPMVVSSPRISGSDRTRLTRSQRSREVAAVGGDLSGSVAFLAEDGSTFADDATGRLWIVDDELNPIDVDEGVAPVAAGEIAVDKGLAGDEDLELGDQVTILTLAGQFDATVVGITSFGNTDAEDSAAPSRSRHPSRSTGSMRVRPNTRTSSSGEPATRPHSSARSNRWCRPASGSSPATSFCEDKQGEVSRVRQGPQGRVSRGLRCWRCSSAGSSSTTRSA